MAEIDLQSFGFLVGTIVVLVVNLENALEVWFWPVWYHLALWATLLLYFLFHLALYSTVYFRLFGSNYSYVGVAKAVLPTVQFWLIVVLGSTAVLLPVFARE